MNWGRPEVQLKRIAPHSEAEAPHAIGSISVARITAIIPVVPAIVAIVLARGGAVLDALASVLTPMNAIVVTDRGADASCHHGDRNKWDERKDVDYEFHVAELRFELNQQRPARRADKDEPTTGALASQKKP